MGNVFYFEWEPALMAWLQAHLGSFGTLLAKLFTLFGEEMLLVAVLGFLYWSYNKQLGLRVGTSLLTASLLNPMVKNIALRKRPYMVHSEVACLKPVDSSADILDLRAQGYSFPSGHSASAVSTYGSLAHSVKKRWLSLAAIALCLLVGISRFCLGVHYPTDVAAGWVLGAAVVLAVSFLEKHVKSRWQLNLILLVIALPGLIYCRSNDYFSALGMMIGLTLGNLFEERFVNFRDTRKPVFMVLRLIGGVACFFGLNTLLKLPFSSDFLNAGTMGAFLIRTLRYAIVVFIIIGVYPMLFALCEKTGKSSSRKADAAA